MVAPGRLPDAGDENQFWPGPDEHGRGRAVLVATNMYPVASEPSLGTFVREQVETLRRRPEIRRLDVLYLNGRARRSNYARAVPGLRRLVHERGYDLVHAHYGLAGAVSVAQRTVPVVVTFHGGDVAFVRWQRWVSRIVARASAANIVVAEPHRELLGRPASVIPCGIDLACFRPRDRAAARERYGIAPGSLALLFPAPPDRTKKRYDRFQRVVAELKRRDIDLAVLHLTGIPREAVPELLAAADVVVMTSVGEGAPVAIMEAIACGVPIVSTPTGHVPWMLEPVTNARVLPFDATQFAEAIIELPTSEDRAPGQGVEAFDEDRVASRIADVYAKAMSVAGS